VTRYVSGCRFTQNGIRYIRFGRKLAKMRRKHHGISRSQSRVADSLKVTAELIEVFPHFSHLLILDLLS
jgi:hypothetical protein